MPQLRQCLTAISTMNVMTRISKPSRAKSPPGRFHASIQASSPLRRVLLVGGRPKDIARMQSSTPIPTRIKNIRLFTLLPYLSAADAPSDPPIPIPAASPAQSGSGTASWVRQLPAAIAPMPVPMAVAAPFAPPPISPPTAPITSPPRAHPAATASPGPGINPEAVQAAPSTPPRMPPTTVPSIEAPAGSMKLVGLLPA